MRSGTRLPAFAVVAAASALLWAGCGGEGGADITEPELGTLEVVTSTAGPEPDPDGYSVSIDDAAPQTMGQNAVVRRDQVPVGTHTVELSGVAANCTVSGPARRTVSIAANAVTSATYAVTCAATTGAIQVTTSTGEPGDADGYRLRLDGADSEPIPADGTVTLAGIAPGPHTVGLTGLSGTCRVEGENPVSLAVTAGETASTNFAVRCDPPPPATGTLELTTTTSGQNLDPDGYRFRIDGGALQDIGINTTVTVSPLAAGDHTVDLRGLAANCAVAGESSRVVTVPDGGVVQLAFDVTCTATTGGLSVSTTTSGEPADPDGYAVTVDGGDPHPVGVNGSAAIDGLAPGSRSVALTGVAANCTIGGQNPRNVAIVAGETAQTAFAVTCSATTGALTVTIAGLPAGTDAAVTVTGPGGFSRQATATATFPDLQPGSYTVSAAEVTAGAIRYAASPANRTVTVAAAGTARVTVTYAAVASPTLNLRIEGIQLTQGVQTADNDLPLVANRDGYLRVFVLASGPNSAAPQVRVRIYRNGNVAATLNIPAPGGESPTARDEGRLSSSWNVKVPRTLIGPGLAVLAEVDPGNDIAESNESDNSFPLSGTPHQPQVRNVSVLGVRFVPVRQRANGLEGVITTDTRGRFLDLTRRLYPLPGTDSDIHAVYTTTTGDPLQPEDANGAWVTVLSELDALRVVEGSDWTYYGVVRPGYSGGLAGRGFLGLPTAMGYDNEFDASRIMAHELGHTWNRDHAPCGGPPDADPQYPYPGGQIGVYGIHLSQEALKPPTSPDIMGYCGDPWISDYTYRAVLGYRAGTGSLRAPASAGVERSLLVWGRIVAGRPVLEPAFEVMTRPRLPAAPGPYTVEARGTDGAGLFSLSFDAAPVADDPRGTRHFAFAVPLSESAAARLGSLRLSGPGGEAAAARPAAPLAALMASDSIVTQRVAGGASVRWNPAAHPMIMVRHPRTGEVLSFARGGQVEVATDQSELELVVSDRVASRRLRVPVGNR